MIVAGDRAVTPLVPMRMAGEAWCSMSEYPKPKGPIGSHHMFPAHAIAVPPLR
jgi:hypothetical protein